MEFERVQIAIDVEGMSHDEQISICRSVMGIVEPDVATGECDIPWGTRRWPIEVQEAALRLCIRAGVSEPTDDQYVRTGVLQLDASCWQDFVIFTPYAFDATFWAARREHDRRIRYLVPDENVSEGLMSATPAHPSTKAPVRD